MHPITKRICTLAVAISAGVCVAQDEFLIVADGNRVFGFDPFDGQLIRYGSFSGSIHARQVLDTGTEWLMLSELQGTVNRYSHDGAFIGNLASFGASNSNPRFGTLHNDQLYLSVSSNSSDPSSIQRFDLDGSNQEAWASVASVPYGMLFRENDVVVVDSGRHDLLSYSLEGDLLGTLHNSNGSRGGIERPTQIAEMSNGNLIVGGLLGTNKIFMYGPDGTELNSWNVGGAVDGVHVLGNGSILFSGPGVGILDTATGLFELVDLPNSAVPYDPDLGPITVSGVFIPSPGSLALVAGAALLGVRRRGR